MLGRTANDLFWLARSIERAENMARLTEVGYRLFLLPREGDGHSQEWQSTLASAGCLDQYNEKYDKAEMANVVNFLLFDESNPSSVQSCLANARRNARAQRTAITRDMWESINTSWIEYSGFDPQRISGSELPRLLDWVKQRSALYRGAMLNTILRNDTYCFSQLGAFLERADNTARILDVKYYVLLPSIGLVGSTVDNVQWAAILRSVTAHRSYRWVYKESYQPAHIAEFLILNQQMPRSLRSCYNEITTALDDLGRFYGTTHACHTHATETAQQLAESTVQQIFSAGLHEFLLDFTGRNGWLASEVAEAYHFNG
ncbi:MAG: alpha-E domain-containing protein [Hyphomicrobiaceae bacterium]